MSPSAPPPSGPVEPSHLVGTHFADRYRVLRLVSEGANTAIYDAVDDQSGREVTLKLVRPRLAAPPSFRTRFDETMRAVASLSHPNIAAVFDWGVAPIGDTSTAYVVIEQLTGGSLRDMFDRGRRLSPSQALVVGLEACRALDHAHRRGFVHTELTPSKLVFGDDRRLRIVDFGLARLLGEPVWQQPDSVPTHVAWYASPEQGRSLPVDGKTDVYALCLALHEAVTGTLPFRNDSTVASLTARVGKLMPVSADLGPLASVFERAGRPEPDERSSAAELGKDLVRAASQLPRPEPLPLLSTSLFETPVERLRAPDDPTGGVVRPTPAEAPIVIVPADEPAADTAPDTAAAPATAAEPATAGDAAAGLGAPVVTAGPGADIPVTDAGDGLVILPLDSGIAARTETTAPIAPVAAEAATSGPSATATQVMPAVAEPYPQRGRRFPWRILIGLVVVAALAVLGVLATRLFRTTVYAVPDVVGLPVAEARNLVAANGWEISIDEERSDEVPDVDHVVRTVPAAGVELAEGEPFLIVVSGGPTLRELPETTGMAVSEAQTLLVARGLEVETEPAFDEEVPAGAVISWTVPGDPTLGAGAQVEPATLVRLIVSEGPEPRVVPLVVGRPVGEARAEVEGLGLGFVESEQLFSDDVPLGVIIAQSIEPGDEVERGTELAVAVSKGPDLVQFPDISGAATYEEAAALLNEAGFVPALVFGDAQGAIRSYTIDGVQPDVGETFRRGTKVDFEAL